MHLLKKEVKLASFMPLQSEDNTMNACRNWLPGFVTGLIVFLLYSKIISFDFINFDDPDYVTQNLFVLKGITKESVRWAFSFNGNGSGSYWHPFAYLAHMLDVMLFGLHSGMHHYSNLFIHIINTVLLYAIILAFSGDRLKSFLVALIFGIHPISVDSVVWISQKKNLLAAFFFLVTIFLYLNYVKKKAWYKYLLMLIACTSGLLCKPLLVTIPFVLLLLDFWPLRLPGKICEKRWLNKNNLILIGEKIPFFVLSVLWMITPIWSRALLSEKISFEEVSMVLRVENCIVSYVKYIGKLLYPENLAIIYPYPQRIPVYLFALALICLLAVSVFVLMNIKKRAYLFMGWFFFLGVLFPFTGLVQGALWPEMADRFVYIPQIGIYLAVIFLGLDYAKKYQKQNVFVITACLMTLYYISTTWNQIETWRNSESLFRHAIEKTENNYIAYNNYGTALEDSGNLSDAESMFKKSLEIKNDFWKAHYNLGTHYLKLKQSEKALDHFESVIKNNDKVYRAYYNAGILLMQKNENERAKKYFQKAIAVKPDFSEALNNLGLLFFYKGQLKIAADYFAGAINAEPSNTGALCNMGNLLVEKGQLRTAIECFNKVLEYEKNNSCALQGLDTVLSVPLSVIRGKKDYNGLLDMGND